MAVYTRMDQLIADFQDRCGLRCPAGCGLCCLTAEVHTTVIEMLPTALVLLQRDEAEKWLEVIDKQSPFELCVFFEKDISPGQSGHCANYYRRPSICRLFGFAAVRDRLGFLELAVCKQLRQIDPETVASAVRYQNQAPSFADCTAQLYAIDPSAKVGLLPINEALKRAIQRVGLQMQLSGDFLVSKSTLP